MASRRSSGKDARLAKRGERLVEAMHRQGIFKQHAFAHLLGVNESTVTRWKNNEAISIGHAIAVCDALSITLDWFLCGLGPMDRTVPTDEEWHQTSEPRGGFQESFDEAWRHLSLHPTSLIEFRSSRDLARCASYNHRLNTLVVVGF